MLRLEYGRMLQDGLDGEHGLTRAAARGPGAPRFPECRPRSAPAAPPGSTGSTTSPSRAAPSGSITQFAERRRPGLRSCAGARHRRLGAGRPCAADGAARAGVERAGRRGAGLLSRGSRSSTTWTRLSVHAALGRIDPRRVLVNVVSKSGSHGGDDGAVPRGPRLARGGARSGGVAPPGVHHRSGARRPARDRAPRGDRGGRRAARRWAGASACCRRWDCCPRRSWGSTSRRC